MRKTKFLSGILLIISLLFSCSNDSLEEIEEDLVVQECSLSVLNKECLISYLNGERSNWIKISEEKDLEGPYFLYSAGQKTEPMGTVTIAMNVNNPTFRINDSQINDILINVTQSSTSQDEACKAEENIIQTTSTSEPDVYIKFTEEFTFPFYLKIKAYTCE